MKINKLKIRLATELNKQQCYLARIYEIPESTRVHITIHDLLKIKKMNGWTVSCSFQCIIFRAKKHFPWTNHRVTDVCNTHKPTSKVGIEINATEKNAPKAWKTLKKVRVLFIWLRKENQLHLPRNKKCLKMQFFVAYLVREGVMIIWLIYHG